MDSVCAPHLQFGTPRSIASGDQGRTAGARSKNGRFADRRSSEREARLAKGEECRCLCRAARDAEHRAEEIVQVAQAIALRRLAGVGAERGLRGVPILVRERRLLREQHGDDEQRTPEAAEHGAGFYAQARHSCRPATNRSRGSFLPMKTRSDCFFSPFPHGLPMSPPIIMCTPWKTTRRALPFIQRMPL